MTNPYEGWGTWGPIGPKPLSSTRLVWTGIGAWLALTVVFGMVAGLMWTAMLLPGDSMSPTINPGTYVLADRTAYTRRSLARGDIVVRSEPYPPQYRTKRRVQRMARVVALGGDTISCCDPSGRVVLNGRPLTETYIGGSQDPFESVEVPPGQMFLMGDHRASSFDSRRDGPSPVKYVTARVLPVHGVQARLARWVLGFAAAGITTIFAGLVWLRRRPRSTRRYSRHPDHRSTP